MQRGEGSELPSGEQSTIQVFIRVADVDSYLIEGIKGGDDEADEALESAHRLAYIANPNPAWSAYWKAEEAAYKEPGPEDTKKSGTPAPASIQEILYHVTVVDSYLIECIKRGDDKAAEALQSAHELAEMCHSDDELWTKLWLSELDAINGRSEN